MRFHAQIDGCLCSCCWWAFRGGACQGPRSQLWILRLFGEFLDTGSSFRPKTQDSHNHLASQ
jgi:hypothetical protein